MTISDTVIPSKVDASATDQQYVTVTSENKLTLGSDYFDDYGEHEIEIIELQANAGVTPLDHDTTVSDTFSDADGLNDTVDTGSTTSVFDTNKYKRGDSIEGLHDTTDYYVNVAGAQPTTSWTDINKYIEKLVVTLDDNYGSGSGTWTARITYSDETYADVSQATPNDPTAYEKANPNPEKLVTSIVCTLTKPSAGGSYQLDLIAYEFVDSTDVVINLPTITGTVTAVELIVNQPETEDGSSLTFDITDGSNSVSDQEINSKILLDSFTSNPTVLTMHLNKGTAGTQYVPSVKTYCLKLWKA